MDVVERERAPGRRPTMSWTARALFLIPLCLGFYLALGGGPSLLRLFGILLVAISVGPPVTGVVNALFAPFERRQAERIARDLHELGRKVYTTSHRYQVLAPGDLERFHPSKAPWYAAVQRELEQLGFLHVADIDPVSLNRAMPQVQAMLRVMAYRRDPVIVAALYSPKVSGFPRALQWVGVIPRNLDTIDLETELSDGRFLVTNNTKRSDTTDAIPGIERDQFDTGTPAAALLDAHRRRLRAELWRDPALRAIEVRGIDEILSQQDRAQAIKSAYRSRRGFITPQEVRRAGWSDSELAEDVAAAMERQRQAD